MKKKILLLVLASVMLAACATKPKVLVAYYSQSGNTEQVARQIHEKFGGDLYQIVPATPYPATEEETIAIVGGQKETGTLPELGGATVNLADYDVVFLGGPIWYGTASLPVMAFARAHDFAGKKVIPFYTCGRGDAGTMVADLTPDLDGATVMAPFGNNRAEREAGTHIAKVAEYLDGLTF